MHLHDPIPSLQGASRWLGEEVSATSLPGAPVLIHLWSSRCPACREELPTLRSWEDRYGPRGLRMVGVHTRTESDQTDEEAMALAREVGFRHPIALDGDEAPIALRLGAHYVPAYFLFDADGRLRHMQSGVSSLVHLERAIERILDEREGASVLSR